MPPDPVAPAFDFGPELAVAAELRSWSDEPVPALGVATLWCRAINADAADPDWADRDRLLSCLPDQGRLANALHRLTGSAADAIPALPPGQALAIAVGLALAERTLAGRFGRSLVNHRIWAVACGTELAEGVAQEAIGLAGNLRLERLCVLCHADDALAAELARRLPASGWVVRIVAADDIPAMDAALSAALRARKPTLIASPNGRLPAWVEGTADGDRWPEPAGAGARARRGWLKRLARHPMRAEFERVMAGRLPVRWSDGLGALKARLVATRPVRSTVETGAEAVATLQAGLPELLDPATVTGPRQRAAAAALAGMALHGGVLPCARQQPAGCDAIRPALRASAAIRARTIQLVTEAFGTAPVEQLAALRATPNLHVLRPGDPVETVECVDLAARRADGPCVLAVSDQAAPTLRGGTDGAENRCARGGYVLAEADGARQATLIATGPELAAAMQARDALGAEQVAVAVVSMPCWELFAQQDATWRSTVLGSAPRVGIEAGCGFGWERWLGADGVFVGPVEPGGAITPDHIARSVRRALPTVDNQMNEADRSGTWR